MSPATSLTSNVTRGSRADLSNQPDDARKPRDSRRDAASFAPIFDM